MTRSHMRTACVFLAAGMLLVPTGPVSAQTTTGAGEGLLLGPLTLWPTFLLRDAGTDSNVFNAPTDERDDRTARLTGTTGAHLRVGLVQVEGTGAVDYLYFERYAAERALNRSVSLRVQPQFNLVRPFVAGSYRRTRDRASSEIDARAPRTEQEYGGGIELRLTPRAFLQSSARRSLWRFEDGERFGDVVLATRLNRRSDVVDLGFRYVVSAVSTITARGGLVRDRFAGSPDRDTDALQAEGGLIFAPDATIRGRALVGFRDMRARGATALPFRGPTASVDLSYTLLDRTVLSGHFARETMVSIESQPYYLSTLTSLDVSHNLVGPLDLLGRIGRERLDYDAVPARGLDGHRDRVDILGSGVAIRGDRTRATVQYEEIRRRSNARTDREFDRRRLYTTFSYGF